VAFQRKKPAAIGAKAPFPGFIEPALATSIEKVPSGDRWIHEIKFDGYRVQVHLANTEVKVFTRRGHEWTHRFKKIASDAWHIGAGSAIIDGEVVAPAADGGTDFSVLQNELKGRSTKIVMVAIDLVSAATIKWENVDPANVVEIADKHWILPELDANKK
jgi:bifunctional non-homologous end joining protein LigD